MSKKNRKVRLLTAIVAAVMLISTLLTVHMSAFGTTYYGESPSISNVSGSLDMGTENLYNESVMYKLPDTVEADDDVSIIIKTQSATLLDAYDKYGAGLSFTEFTKTEKAEEIRRQITDNSISMLEKLSGISYQLGESYNVVMSGFEIVIKAADFKDVCKAMSGSAQVIVGESYKAAETQLVENSVNVYGTGIFNSDSFQDKYGYDGTGIVVAVLDTGLDYYHSAFLDKNYTADRSKLGLTFSQVADILANNDMAAEQREAGLTAEDVYISDKVPFGFDYADNDSDVFPLLSNHGTHVAGVIAGNFLPHIESEDYSGEFVGVAPGAQVVPMKIFSDVEASARTSWILAALEDCVTLGVDVINMSIGTACGFSRHTDKESISGVYDEIRERGISLVVAASNSFNSGYSSDKNGNLPLTSNPDSSTVGSPSTYLGALSVASIEGAKTPYLTYGETIMYFIESNDRFSEEKHFVEELLAGSGSDRLELEYVLVAGAGRTAADYTGIDVTGKIALIKRGYNTFEEKVALAEKMGAAGVIIYNNVSGDIKMNVGETDLPVCSISQNDGEMLAKAGSGKIVISRSQTSGPFISDFSSWGPTPDLMIKPEITAHGGAILSSVPGESYDRISGTSMATPNISGVTALLREFVINKFGYNPETEAIKITETVNRLMMSTADIILNKNGLPYSVRKQGAGLANLTDSAATNAYILTYNKDGSIMDKPKIELGDDAAKKGVYTLNFAIVNFGSSALSYDLGAYVLTEGVSETKTAQGETTVTETAYELKGAKVEILSVNGGSLDGNSISVNAGATAKVSVKITLTEENKKYLNDSFENGMYVEGYITLNNSDDTQDLNIPYLAFYGDWTKSPLFDLDFYETNADELDDSIDMLDKTLPDAYATRPIGGSTGDYVSYLGSYYFEQNPANKIIAADRKYISLSNQTANNEINSLRFVWAGMLRNAQRVEIVITEDSTGEIVYQTTDYDIRKSYGDGGPIRPANIDIEFSAIEHNLKNNTRYTVTMKGYLDYGDGGADTNLNNTFTFPITTDFSAPVLTGCEFYTEYDRSTKQNRLFAKMAIYDNHYSMALQAGYVGKASDGSPMFYSFDKYATPIYSESNSTTYVVYELTDYLDEIISGAFNKNTFTIATYDYAMNSATYEIALPDDFKAFYFEETDITLSPNEVYNLSPVVYPASEWGEMITYKSNNRGVVNVVNNQLVAVKSGGAIVTAQTPDGKQIRLRVTVLKAGDSGYKEYSKPVAKSFNLTGYYVNKAFFMMDTTQRDIGSTGGEMKFAGGYALSMFPSESVTLRYELHAYFPSDTKVVFSSGNESIVKVDQYGKITAVSEGLASITAKVMMDGKSTLYSATVSVNVKEPFITSGPSLTNYFGSGDSANHVTFPSTLAITEIGQFAFSNYDYVEKGPDDIINDESPESMKLWFKGDSNIRQVTIPEGVTRIGPYAFAGITTLEKVVLPSTLETIDYGAFYGCTKLTTVEGIEHVKFINQSAFQGCIISGNINLKSAVAIGEYAFAEYPYYDINGNYQESKNQFTSLTLSEDCKSIGAYAFSHCDELVRLTIKSDFVKLGQFVFDTCSALEGISINASVIPSGAFNECTSLKNVILGKDVAVIEEYAFSNTKIESFIVDESNANIKAADGGKYLTNYTGDQIILISPVLTSFTLDDPSITSVGLGAFSGNAYLTSVNIPSVTSVEDYAFSKCPKLADITLGTLTHIGSFAFEGTAITEFEFNDNMDMGIYAFADTQLERVFIGNDFVIPEGAFAYCEKLTTVIIGDNVTVGEYAFFNDSYHADHYIVTRRVYDSATGTYKENEYAIYYVVMDGPITSLTIGKNATLLDGAFYGAANLESVTLGKGASIGDRAFYNCASLVDIDLSGVKYIGESAFSGDVHYEYTTANYTSVDINENGEYTYRYYAPTFTSVDLSSLEGIGKTAFALCKNLESVTLGADLRHIAEGAFQYCDKLSYVNLENVFTIGDYAFAEGALLEVDLSLAEVIGKYAFCYNKELSSLILNESGAEIGEGAFSYCESLSEITNENKATYVGDYAFAYTDVSSVDLSAATYIGTHAFYKESLTDFTVVLGELIKNMGDNPFANCKVAPFSSTVTEGFLDQIYTTVIYSFDLSDNIRIIDGSIYRVVPKGLELIAWMGDDYAVVAEDTVRISAMAFASHSVRQVVLPYTVAAIGHKAFFGCEELQFISFASYESPVLEEEYDSLYFESMEHIPATGEWEFENAIKEPVFFNGNGTVPYYMWNITSLPCNFFYGANFIDYVGYVEDKITMIRPSNGKCYDSFILNQYFDMTIDGASAPDSITLAAIDAIKGLPTNAKEITLAHKAQVVAARTAYDRIVSYEQRALVPSEVLAILTNAEQRIADLEYLKGGNQDALDPIVDGEINLLAIINIVIGVVFVLVVLAFTAVLILFIIILKKGGIDLLDVLKPEKKEEIKKLLYDYEPVAQIIHKAAPVPKLKKQEFVGIETLIQGHKESANDKRKLYTIIGAAVGAVLIILLIIFAILRGNDNYYSSYEKDGYTVSVVFDADGGTFKGSDSTVVDLYNPEKVGSDGIKLLAPDDSRRGKNNALTVTKAGYFLAGWYTGRELVDEKDPSKGYTYSGRWDFENDRLTLDPDKTYSTEESALTLYAAWVPYYTFEIYSEDNVLVATTSAINLTIPRWQDGDVTLNMDNFPTREGYTLDKVDYSESDVIVTETETKTTITGKWDEETATSLTPTIKLYATWQEGERYRVYSTDDLRKNADAEGYYEIYADLDFSEVEWPSVFTNGKFSGKIFGNGHTISGVSIESTSRSRISNGLFSSLDETAYIENLKFKNLTHTIDLMSVAPGASFGLLAGSAAEGTELKNVSVSGKLLIGDSCAGLVGNSDYVISKLCGIGELKGVSFDVTVEKVNPGNASFDIKIEEDGTVSIIQGSN